MNLRTISSRVLLGIVGLMAAAAPSYAGWGPVSDWAYAANNDTVYCYLVTSKTLPGLTQYTYSPVKLSAYREALAIPTKKDIYYLVFDNASLTNATGKTVDVFTAGYDINDPPGSFLPYFGTIKAMATNSMQYFSNVVQAQNLLHNLQANCQVAPQGTL